MEEITKKRLEKAGWYPNRKINLDLIERGYVENGLKMPDNVKLFLEEFGMLDIRFLKKYTGFDSEERIVFDPLLEIEDYFDREYIQDLLSSDYGIEDNVYPIGECSRGNLYMMMTENNIFYSFTDGCLLKDGNNIEGMLDCVVGECHLSEEIE